MDYLSCLSLLKLGSGTVCACSARGLWLVAALAILSTLMGQSLIAERHGRILRLTLNRAEKRNALNAELCGSLAEAVESADADPKSGAILLAAAGPTFCAGMDLAEAQSAPPDGLAELHERLFTLGSRLSR